MPIFPTPYVVWVTILITVIIVYLFNCCSSKVLAYVSQQQVHEERSWLKMILAALVERRAEDRDAIR